MSRRVLVINTERDRETVATWARRAPWGWRVEFKEVKRSDEQNALMWVLLTKVARQLKWPDSYYDPDDWKDYFMHALKKARWMPAEEGGMVPIGMRTSDLGVSEMSDLIELIYAFGARHGVVFDEVASPDTAADALPSERGGDREPPPPAPQPAEAPTPSPTVPLSQDLRGATLEVCLGWSDTFEATVRSCGISAGREAYWKVAVDCGRIPRLSIIAPSRYAELRQLLKDLDEADPHARRKVA